MLQWLSGRESTCNTGVPGNMDSIPELGISPGGGYGNPLYYSCLENPMERGFWWATVHRVAKSWTGLSMSMSISDLVCCTVESNTTL